jgi:hypothetical protein
VKVTGEKEMPRQPQIISRIPQKGMSGEKWGLVVENELVKIWLSMMSSAERETFGQRGIAGLGRSAFTKLDNIILRQAETLGWRIGLSELVRFRFSEWDLDPKSPEMHRKYGLAVARSARIMQRKELPPIQDPDQWLVKQETVEELRVLLQNMRAKFAIERKKSTPETLFSAAVTESPGSFPHLAANLERWQKFFEKNPHTLRPMTVGDRAKPGALYDEFMAWSTGWEPDSVRQAISRLKP